MFPVTQKLVARLRDRWSTVGPTVQLLIAAFIILISAPGPNGKLSDIFLDGQARLYGRDKRWNLTRARLVIFFEDTILSTQSLRRPQDAACAVPDARP